MKTTVKRISLGKSLELCIHGGSGPGGQPAKGNRYDILTPREARVLAYTLLMEAEKQLGSK